MMTKWLVIIAVCLLIIAFGVMILIDERRVWVNSSIHELQDKTKFLSNYYDRVDNLENWEEEIEILRTQMGQLKPEIK